MGITATQNETLVRNFVEIVKNKRELGRIGEFFASNYIEHNEVVASFGKSIEGYQRFLSHLFEAYPDDKVTIEQIVASDDWVAYRASESGTNKAMFLDIPATGKRATWTEIQFFRIANGKIVEHWVDVDFYGWMQQLGLIPNH